MINGIILWVILLALFYMAYSMGVRSAMMRVAQQEPPPLPETLALYHERLSPVMAILGQKAIGEVLEYEGMLRGGTEEVYAKIHGMFAGEPVSPLLLDGEHGHVRVMLVPRESIELPVTGKTNWALHWLLFAATMATTTWAGALQAGVNLLREPGRFMVGLPYSVALLLILGSHELGHYFTARRHGVRVTPPYFIPVPFALGTFGAFIKIQSLTPNRRALFDIAVAGPLAGLVFAVPALMIGLRYSHLVADKLAVTPDLVGHGVEVGSSVLLACLAKLSLGDAAVADGGHLVLHPLAFAGWIGLFVTALNLLPIGQLDGGHISHALFGTRNARSLSVTALAILFLLALFKWPGLMFWAFIVYFMAGTRDAPAANDVTPLGFWRKALGYAAFVILLLIITPVPKALHETMGLHSPYL